MLEHLLILLSSISGYNNSAAVSENNIRQIEQLSEVVLNDNSISDEVKGQVVERLMSVERRIGKSLTAIDHIIVTDN